MQFVDRDTSIANDIEHLTRDCKSDRESAAVLLHQAKGIRLAGLITKTGSVLTGIWAASDYLDGDFGWQSIAKGLFSAVLVGVSADANYEVAAYQDAVVSMISDQAQIHVQ